MTPQLPESDSAAARRAHVEALSARLLQASPIYGFALAGIEIEGVSRGVVTTGLRLGAQHVNSKGMLHGAMSAAVVDFTTGLAIASRDLRTATGTSVDMHLSYASAARAGDRVRIETRAERVGGSLAFVTVRIMRVGKSEEEVVVTGSHTKYVRGTAPEAKAE